MRATSQGAIQAGDGVIQAGDGTSREELDF